MTCDSCCQAPVIINTGGESPGGGLVDSVTGLNVIDATPTTGDVEVSVIPGGINDLVSTNNQGEVLWQPHAGNYNLEVRTGTTGIITGTHQAMWTRIGNNVNVYASIRPGNPPTTAVEYNITVPFTMAAIGANPAPPIVGTVTSIDTGSNNSVNGSIRGAFNNDNERLFFVAPALAGGANEIHVNFAYRAVPR